MVGQKRLLLGIEVTLFGILVFQTLAVSGGGDLDRRGDRIDRAADRDRRDA